MITIEGKDYPLWSQFVERKEGDRNPVRRLGRFNTCLAGRSFKTKNLHEGMKRIMNYRKPRIQLWAERKKGLLEIVTSTKFIEGISIGVAVLLLAVIILSLIFQFCFR